MVKTLSSQLDEALTDSEVLLNKLQEIESEKLQLQSDKVQLQHERSQLAKEAEGERRRADQAAAEASNLKARPSLQFICTK